MLIIIDVYLGKVGITLDGNWFVAHDINNPADLAAAERALAFHFQWFAEPILVSGDYPDVMRQFIKGRNSLPTFTDDEKLKIKGIQQYDIKKNTSRSVHFMYTIYIKGSVFVYLIIITVCYSVGCMV